MKHSSPTGTTSSCNITKHKVLTKVSVAVWCILGNGAQIPDSFLRMKTADPSMSVCGGPALPAVPTQCFQDVIRMVLYWCSLTHLQRVSWCTVCTAGSLAQTWMCGETWGDCKLTPVSPLEPGVTWIGSPDASAGRHSRVPAVCSPPCSMAEAGAWRTHQDGPLILQLGPGPAPNQVWISLIAGESLTSSAWHKVQIWVLKLQP